MSKGDDQVWAAAVEKAAENANYVFKESCNHTKQAIDYMRAVLHQAELQPAGAPAGATTSAETRGRTRSVG